MYRTTAELVSISNPRTHNMLTACTHHFSDAFYLYSYYSYINKHSACTQFVPVSATVFELYKNPAAAAESCASSQTLNTMR